MGFPYPFGYSTLGFGVGGFGRDLPNRKAPPPQLFSNAVVPDTGYGDGGFGDGGYGSGGTPIWMIDQGAYGFPGFGEGGYGDGGNPPCGALLGLNDGINGVFYTQVVLKRAQIFVNGRMQTLNYQCAASGRYIVFLPGFIPPVSSIINVIGWIA
jgi:hypothetical protein